MDEFDWKGLEPADVEYELDAICVNLTGQELRDCEGDHAGTYFTRDNWVSAHGIAQALISAFALGKDS